MPALHSDADVHREAVDALTRDLRVDATRITVRVVNGVVTLQGTVDSYPSRAAAEAATREVSGVVEVINQLAIVPSLSRTDSEIGHEVRTDLGENVELQSQQIQVVVRAGVVHLTGVVSSLELKWLAEEISWWTAGVRDVVSELAVEPPSAPVDR